MTVTASFSLSFELDDRSDATPPVTVASSGQRPARHLAHPLRIVGGRFATVPQDSLEHVTSTVEATLRCRAGDRVDEPRFGLPDVAFRTGEAIEEVVRTAVRQWAHPLAKVTVVASPDDGDDLAENVTVSIGLQEASDGS